MEACILPFEPDFMKYETVIGIIGKTQGVRIAINPAPKAIKKNIHNGVFPSSTGLLFITGAGGDVETEDAAVAESAGFAGIESIDFDVVANIVFAPSKVNENSVSPGMHLPSSHV